MKSGTRWNTLVASTALLLGAFAVAPASAAMISIDMVGADWTNVAGGSNLAFINTDGITGNEEIRWGGNTANSQKSGYRFDGAAPPSFNVPVNTSFVLGDFTHFNNPIPSGSGISSAQLNLRVDLTVNGNPLQEGPFTFSFLHNETPNASSLCPGQAPPCDDIVTVSNLASTDTFTVNGELFTLAIEGFIQGGIVTTQFNTVEGQTNMAQVQARFQSMTPVPEPATVSLFGIGLLGLGVFLRRRRQTT